MADLITKQLEPGVTRSNIQHVDPRRLKVDWSKNLSRGGQEPPVDDRLIELAKDMMPKAGQGDTEQGTSGQLNPILVRYGDGKDQPLEVVGGFRRMRAAPYLIESGLCTDFTVKYVISRLSTAEAALVNLSENLQREDPKPIQMAYAVRSLNEDYGLSFKTIAGRLKRSESWCRQMLDLLSLPEPIKAQVNEGSITTGAARDLAKMPAGEAQSVVDRASQDGGKITPKRIKEAAKPEGEATPRTAREIRRYWEDRTPTSEPDKVMRLMMLGFLDGSATDDDMDRFLDEHFDNYRGESLDGED